MIDLLSWPKGSRSLFRLIILEVKAIPPPLFFVQGEFLKMLFLEKMQTHFILNCLPVLFFWSPEVVGVPLLKVFFEKIREFPQEGIKKAARKLTSVRLFPPDALKSCVVLQFRTLNFLSPRKGLGRTFDLNSITLIRCFSQTPPENALFELPQARYLDTSLIMELPQGPFFNE